jgi:aspartate aminotransferase
MYLSVCFARLLGQPGVDGRPMEQNEQIRRWLLEKAGVAVVPFQAFDLPGETGWFRMSVGAVSLSQLDEAFSRLKAVL